MSNPFDAFDPTADTDSTTAQTNTDRTTAREDSTTDYSAGHTDYSAGYDSAGYDSTTVNAEDYDRYAFEQGPRSDWNLPPIVWVYVGLSVLSLIVGLILIALDS